MGFVFTNAYLAYIKLILKGGIFRSCNFQPSKQPYQLQNCEITLRSSFQEDQIDVPYAKWIVGTVT